MISLTSAVTALIGFITVYLLGFWLIPYLKKLKFGQTIREEGPKWHSSKQGTPTMGGIMIIIGVVFAVIIGLAYGVITKDNIFAELSDKYKTVRAFSALGLAICMGIIGFADDYIKVVKKRNLGLTARQKTFGQLIVTTAYLAVLLLFGGMSTTYIPFVGDVAVNKGIGLIFWPIALFFVYGFVNAVNLTDGIDGLASAVTLVVCCAFMVLGGMGSYNGANLVASAAAGGCVGFVMWNAHPAKVFMGDTGSLFLGGLVVGLSFAINAPILLILMGIVYLAEALSVVIQVAYFKRTKKRIFKMTPIHHHFEMCNWSEDKIVFVFSFITLAGSLLAILAFLSRTF